MGVIFQGHLGKFSISLLLVWQFYENLSPLKAKSFVKWSPPMLHFQKWKKNIA
jgi:hypothetical protein